MDIGKMMPEELSAAEVSSLFDWSEDELAAMDEVEFRARFRERCHHTMEIQVYEHAFRGKPLAEKQIATAEKYLRSWDRRGLSHDCHEYRYVQKLLEFARTLIAGEVPDLSSYGPEWLTPREVRVFERALYERRSVRHWDISRRIPDELIDKILRAGLWAAHLQSEDAGTADRTVCHSGVHRSCYLCGCRLSLTVSLPASAARARGCYLCEDLILKKFSICAVEDFACLRQGTASFADTLIF